MRHQVMMGQTMTFHHGTSILTISCLQIVHETFVTQAEYAQVQIRKNDNYILCDAK